jgi:hypothetical protein
MAKMTDDLTKAACWAFEHFYHLDQSNAQIHCAPVRFSPITFRLAEALSEYGAYITDNFHLRQVIEARGQYAEDKGR